ncbi:hypothetical protein ASF98_06970 [Arthrobacter sp. Leaf337]|uniref:hypothetical protein n=1 Tax=Arthrobacter sp. Leaf337 TaxID=1736342 RepID=UPI0006FA94D3|nr:hypothetical protein [Arthrobacter sp. Leaf337]KQR75548.1 hypothetical protein ASF98_06970 [Arthrobacter sp. Leaf337]
MAGNEPDQPENEVLKDLVGQLDAVLDRVGPALRGRPLFVVEKVLARELRRCIPAARFGADDIRRWSGENSS